MRPAQLLRVLDRELALDGWLLVVSTAAAFVHMIARERDERVMLAKADNGFLMAELTETSYAYIMMIAIFPALLYFFSVFCMIHFEAKRYGLYGVDDPDAPTAWQILKKEWFLVTPLALIVVLMLMGKSAGFSAVVATARR